MQETDEQGHTDYVYALYNAGGWFNARNGVAEDYVTEQVQYLVSRSNFWPLRTFSAARAAPGYGTLADLQDIDRNAPRPPRPHFSPGDAVPYVAFIYPAGYYVLAASAMQLAAHLSNGSLVATYFAARGVGIICLAVNLFVSYAILRQLRLSITTSLLVTFALGLFPLASWVSAYVQPDTLVWLCTTIVLYLALRWRERPFDGLRSALLLLALSATFFVKTQYALGLTAACLLMIVGYFFRPVPSIQLRLLVLVSMLLAPGMAFAAAGIATPVGHLISQNPATIAASSKADLAPWSFQKVATEAALGLAGTYLPGETFRTFWLSFGDLITRFLGPGLFRRIVTLTLTLGSIYVVVLMLLRQLKIWRIFCLTARKHRNATLRLLLGDPVLNVYVVWITLLLAVFVVSGMNLFLEGRYLLPILLPTMLLGVFYAPRMLPVRQRNALAMTFAIAWAAYSALMSPIAISAMESRFYGPTSYRQPKAFVRVVTVRRLDTGEAVFSLSPGTVPPRALFEFAGVAVSLSRKATFDGVKATMDNQVLLPVIVFNKRHYDGISLGKYTFRSPRRLAPGPHMIDIAPLPSRSEDKHESFRFTVSAT